jgi:hypothetical protein
VQALLTFHAITDLLDLGCGGNACHVGLPKLGEITWMKVLVEEARDSMLVLGRCADCASHAVHGPEGLRRYAKIAGLHFGARILWGETHCWAHEINGGSNTGGKGIGSSTVGDVFRDYMAVRVILSPQQCFCDRYRDFDRDHVAVGSQSFGFELVQERAHCREGTLGGLDHLVHLLIRKVLAIRR